MNEAEGHGQQQHSLYTELGFDSLTDPKTITQEDIKRLYRKRAVELHPDKQTDPAEKIKAEEKFKRLNEIYEILSDPAKRKNYDSFGFFNKDHDKDVISACAAMTLRVAESGQAGNIIDIAKKQCTAEIDQAHAMLKDNDKRAKRLKKAIKAIRLRPANQSKENFLVKALQREVETILQQNKKISYSIMFSKDMQRYFDGYEFVPELEDMPPVAEPKFRLGFKGGSFPFPPS